MKRTAKKLCLRIRRYWKGVEIRVRIKERADILRGNIIEDEHGLLRKGLI